MNRAMRIQRHCPPRSAIPRWKGRRIKFLYIGDAILKDDVNATLFPVKFEQRMRFHGARVLPYDAGTKERTCQCQSQHSANLSRDKTPTRTQSRGQVFRLVLVRQFIGATQTTNAFPQPKGFALSPCLYRLRQPDMNRLVQNNHVAN